MPGQAKVLLQSNIYPGGHIFFLKSLSLRYLAIDRPVHSYRSLSVSKAMLLANTSGDPSSLCPISTHTGMLLSSISGSLERTASLLQPTKVKEGWREKYDSPRAAVSISSIRLPSPINCYSVTMLGLDSMDNQYIA